MNTKSIFYVPFYFIHFQNYNEYQIHILSRQRIIFNILSDELYGTYPDLWPGNHFNCTFILIVLSGELYSTYPDLWLGNHFKRTFR